MKTSKKKYNYLTTILLCCILQMAGCAVYAQQILSTDSIGSISPKESIKYTTDSLLNISNAELQPIEQQTADSIQEANEKNLEELETNAPIELPDSTGITGLTPLKKQWIPNSTKATWLAVVFPGAGQIYNKKYWKLPIIYGGFAGCAYALAWNTNMYKDYSQAYLDIMDSNPNTNSHLNLLPPNYRYNEAQLKELIRKRKDTYRRYRDMSIFAVIGVYLISIIDAYVDAELSDFDITPDLSLHIEPTINTDNKIQGGKNVGVQCSLRF